LDLSFATDSPTAAQIANVLGVSRQAVAKQLVSPPFCAWLDSELRRLAGRQRALARAKFAYLAMSGSIEHFKALGW
jgi:hypothetical protein